MRVFLLISVSHSRTLLFCLRPCFHVINSFMIVVPMEVVRNHLIQVKVPTNNILKVNAVKPIVRTLLVLALLQRQRKKTATVDRNCLIRSARWKNVAMMLGLIPPYHVPQMNPCQIVKKVLLLPAAILARRKQNQIHVHS